MKVSNTDEKMNTSSSHREQVEEEQKDKRDMSQDIDWKIANKWKTLDINEK